MSKFFTLMSDVGIQCLFWLEKIEFAGFSALNWAFFMFVGFCFLRFILFPALGGRPGFHFGQGSSDSVKDSTPNYRNPDSDYYIDNYYPKG